MHSSKPHNKMQGFLASFLWIPPEGVPVPINKSDEGKYILRNIKVKWFLGNIKSPRRSSLFNFETDA